MAAAPIVEPTTPRLAVLASGATKSGAAVAPRGCCRKNSSTRCEGSPDVRLAFAVARCTGRFLACKAFAPIPLTSPEKFRSFETPDCNCKRADHAHARDLRQYEPGETGYRADRLRLLIGADGTRRLRA